MNEFDNDRLLTDAFRAIAEADAALRASSGVEARLVSDVRTIARARRMGALKLYATAAVLVLAVGGSVWSLRGPVSDLTLRSPTPDPRFPELTTEFFPLHYSSVPVVDPRIVRLQVSRAALARFGVESVRSTSDTVLADVIVGSDGLARAVRFVIEEHQ